MADGSHIEWTDATWNPITGCSVVSPGCTNCYAMKLAGGRLRHHPSRAGLTAPSKAGPVWNGEVRFNREWLTQPLAWSRPRRIFVCAHGDLFAEGVPDEWIDQVFAVMAIASQHTFQVLTKRPARMRAYLTTPDRFAAWGDHALGELGASSISARPDGALANVWLGISAEDQTRFDERWPDLRETPAAVRILSAEPLLGPLEILPGLGWVIVGGESGSGARYMHRAWVRPILADCTVWGIPFFFKQWGAWAQAPELFNYDEGQAWARDLRAARCEHHSDGSTFALVGKKAAGRRLDGRTHDAMPGPR